MLGIGSGSFNPETLVVLETAFDEAWITLKTNGSANIRPNELARRICHLAMEGERDPVTDPRVLYWEPAKWIARLRRLRTDDNMIAFRINLDAGHAGAAGRFDRLREVALAYAFAIKVAGAAHEFCTA